MHRLVLALALFTLLGAASAQRFFVGFPVGGAFTSADVALYGGLQFGSYKLFNDFGVRALAKGGAVILEEDAGPLVEGGLDGLYSVGEGVVFYTGAGLGYGSLIGTGSVYVGGFVGLDFDAASTISLFVEINPRYYVRGAGLVHLRSGINFHIGSTGQDPAALTDTCCVNVP